MKPFDEELSDNLAREVLASARRDRPATAARERALAAGLGALGPVPPAARGESSGTDAPGTGAAKVGVLKWIAAAAGAAIVAGAIVTLRPSAEHAEVPAATPPVQSTDTPTSASTESTPTSASTESTSAPGAIEESAPSAAPPPLPNAPRKAAPAPAAPGDALGEEIALVDAARGALNAGDPAKALARLDAYDRDHENGSLKLEASVLRVEALARSGRRAEADRLGRSVLAAPGGGAYRAKLERILGEDR